MDDEGRNRLDVSGQSRSVVPTVYLVGIDELDRIPEFLALGIIVVVSPDLMTLRKWQHEQGLAEPLTDRSTREPTAVVIEMNGGGGHVPKHATLFERARVPRMLTESARRIGHALRFEEIPRLNGARKLTCGSRQRRSQAGL
jgi:hypothetical protein